MLKKSIKFGKYKIYENINKINLYINLNDS